MNRYLAELVGTFALVFCGTGAIISNEISGGQVTHLGIAMTFGLIVMAMIYTFGDTSGAHLNPAVTIGFWAANRFPRKQILPYFLAQFMGAFVASGLLKIMFPNISTLGETLPTGGILPAFILEFVMTFLLMLVIIHVATGSKEKGVMAGIAIGATVLLEATFGGPISGASMNPVRSLAPALVSGNLQDIWIYLIAPVLGALLGILVYNFTKPNLKT